MIRLSRSDKFGGLPWQGSDGLFCTEEVAQALVRDGQAKFES